MRSAVWPWILYAAYGILLGILLHSMSGCQGMQRGEVVSLQEVLELPAPPPVAPPPPPSVPVSVPAPDVTPGTLRAWIPRQQSPNGDVVEGHFLVISPTAPRAETLEPAKTVPRVPAPHYAPQKPVPTVLLPVDQLPPGTVPRRPPAGTPPSVLPPGFVVPGFAPSVPLGTEGGMP